MDNHISAYTSQVGQRVPIELVREEREKIVNEDLLQRIRKCESGNNDKAKNSKSSASGRYQYLSSSWDYYGKLKWGSLEGRSVWNGDDQEELTRWVIGKYGTSPWNESKSCWSK